MTRIVVALVVAAALPSQLLAQERDRPLERIGLALRDPRSNVGGDSQEALPRSTRQALRAPIVEPLPSAIKLGPFTLGTPQLQGEVIRVSFPIGEYVSKAGRAFGAAHRRRQEAAARRQVETDLKSLARRQSPQ